MMTPLIKIKAFLKMYFLNFQMPYLIQTTLFLEKLMSMIIRIILILMESHPRE